MMREEEEDFNLIEATETADFLFDFLLAPYVFLDLDGSSPFWICSTVVCLCKSPRFSNSFPQMEHFNFGRPLAESELVEVIFESLCWYR